MACLCPVWERSAPKSLRNRQAGGGARARRIEARLLQNNLLSQKRTKNRPQKSRAAFFAAGSFLLRINFGANCSCKLHFATVPTQQRAHGLARQRVGPCQQPESSFSNATVISFAMREAFSQFSSKCPAPLCAAVSVMLRIEMNGTRFT